jgi:hypothetical protein
LLIVEMVNVAAPKAAPRFGQPSVAPWRSQGKPRLDGNDEGIILPANKRPLLLDFPPLPRD